jgi:hypothetical protein
MTQLPTFEQQHALHTMQIVRLDVTLFKRTKVSTHFDIVSDKYEPERNVQVQLFTVDDPRVRGYLPSKVWVHDDPQSEIGPRIEMSFYVNPTLPAAAKPFGDGPMYVFALQSDTEEVVEYDVQTRIFIDHILGTDGNIWYVFCFGQAQYDQIVVTSPVERPAVAGKPALGVAGEQVVLDGKQYVIVQVIDNGMFGCAQVLIEALDQSGDRRWVSVDQLVLPS